MPLNPSGNTPTSSPSCSRRSAFAGHGPGVAGPPGQVAPARGARRPGPRRAGAGSGAAGCSSCSPVCSMIASSGSTPEWLATSSAPPVAGTCSSPRISTRNHCWYSSRASGISSRVLNSGSKPNSSTSPSPVTWRRANRSVSAQPAAPVIAGLPGEGAVGLGTAIVAGPAGVTPGSSPVLPSQPTVFLSRRALPQRPGPAASGPAASIPTAGASTALLLVPPLHARLAQQLAVLLLRHSLAALLDDGAHDTTLTRDSGKQACDVFARCQPAGPTPTPQGTCPAPAPVMPPRGTASASGDE